MLEDRSPQIDFISRVLFRCWVLGFALLTIGVIGSQLAHSFVVDLNTSMFGLGPHEIDVILYCSFGFLKLLVLTFFFIPWLSLKWATAK